MGTHPIFGSDFDCLTVQNLLKMKYVAAVLLAQLGGNESPSASDVNGILASVGIDVDEEKLNKVIGELAGKNIDEVLAEGREKLASVPSGGAAPAAGGAAGAGGAAAEEAPKEEAKKEESEEESDDDMGFGLFD